MQNNQGLGGQFYLYQGLYCFNLSLKLVPSSQEYEKRSIYIQPYKIVYPAIKCK